MGLQAFFKICNFSRPPVFNRENFRLDNFPVFGLVLVWCFTISIPGENHPLFWRLFISISPPFSFFFAA